MSMVDVEEAVTKRAGNPAAENKTLTIEAGDHIFELYKKKLQAADKAAVYAQFTMMRLTVLPPDEVRITSPSELTNMYAREQRSDLLDFYEKETGMVVRITTEVVEDEDIKASQKVVVLSKSEMFDAMASKNPALGKLKDGLGMQIEY